MKTRFIIILCCLSVLVYGQGLDKKYMQNQTYTYYELLDAYEKLSSKSEWLSYHKDSLQTDLGVSVPIIRVGAVAQPLEERTTPVILILNGIHAGESCGVDASLHWVEQLIDSGVDLSLMCVYIVPIYNVGGSFNRSCCTRANQNGPEIKGFRGNASNLDLNRDFMKCDSKNALSFTSLFQSIEPDVLVDTHSTNGADYQYAMTLIPYNWEKWPNTLAEIGQSWFERIKEETNKKVPTQYYVNVWGKTPQDGFTAFEVTSIFSGGYAGLFNTLNFTAEAHMFKPYSERVEATINTLDITLKTTKILASEIISARRHFKKSPSKNGINSYVTTWEIDSSVTKQIEFKGYEAEYYKSPLTGQPTYKYNRDKPINYQTTYWPNRVQKSTISSPTYYYLHAGNPEVVKRLKANHVIMQKIEDTLQTMAHVNFVKNIDYAKQPYEGHFRHSNFELFDSLVSETFYPGDLMISLNQPARNYILEVLEPETPGSFFRWNFFDTYLQQKEWFSSYIFEEKAIVFLDDNPDVKANFEKERAQNEAFANNHFAQLYWIYKQTPYYEKEHMRIPVFRVFNPRM